MMQDYSKTLKLTGSRNTPLKLVSLGDLSIAEEEKPPGSRPPNPTASIRIRDVTPHALGVMVWDDKHRKWVNRIVIPKDTPLPCSRVALFTTTQDNQTEGSITLLQGEDEDPQYCTILGEKDGYVLTGIPPQPKEIPQITVILKYDRENMVHVIAKETSSGQELSICIAHSELLSDEQKKELVQQIQRISREQSNNGELL